jgi:type I restriction enzyme, R subunit
MVAAYGVVIQDGMAVRFRYSKGELTDDDLLVYVSGVIKGKLLDNEMLVQQAASNSKEQFSNSPDLVKAITDAIIDAFDANTRMSALALGSQRIQDGIKDVLLGPAQLYEALRERYSERPTS